MGKKETIERIDKDGEQAAIHAQREAEEARLREEREEGVPTSYRVAGQHAYLEHEPGSEFEATLDPVEEALLLASGVLVKTAAVEVEYASEAAERRAQELEVDPSAIKPSGSGNKATVADVEAAAENHADESGEKE